MRTHTDSEITTYNEDGSWTTKSEITTYPATKEQQLIAVACLAGVVALPFIPMAYIAVCDKISARRAARKAAKKNA